MPDPIWTTPKTNWVATDRFMASDWIRINNNVGYLNLFFQYMGYDIPFTPYTDVTDGVTLLTPTDRNNVTDALDEMYRVAGVSWNRGFVSPRVPYGSAWNDKDLNIIENLCLGLYELSRHVPEFEPYVYYYSDEIYCGDVVSVGLL